MTPQAFNVWLAEMKLAGLAKSDAAAARRLGVTPTGLLGMKKNGTDRRTALACAALLAGLEPYARESLT